MKNQEIRKALYDAGLYQWELAEILGIAETTLCVKLRKELPDEERAKMLEIIKKHRKTKGV